MLSLSFLFKISYSFNGIQSGLKVLLAVRDCSSIGCAFLRCAHIDEANRNDFSQYLQRYTSEMPLWMYECS